jgi:hypothetical protein
MNRTSPSERIRSGYVPIEIRYHDGTEPRKMTLWCEHQEEARILMDESVKEAFPGFRGKYFCLAPGLNIISLERTDWLKG